MPYHTHWVVFSLQDLVARTETNKLVADLLNLDRVRSLLKTISLRRQFLRHLEQKRAANFEKGKQCRWPMSKDGNSQSSTDIPSIVVDNMPSTPPMSSRDIASAGLEQSSPGSPTPANFRLSQPDYSLALDATAGSRLQRSRWTDYSSYSMDISKSRYGITL